MKTPKPNQEALDILKKIEKLDKRIMMMEYEREGSTRMLELVCVHDETVKKHDYQPGGYLDRCKYINKIVCEVCGKVIEEEIIIGGFN